MTAIGQVRRAGIWRAGSVSSLLMALLGILLQTGCGRDGPTLDIPDEAPPPQTKDAAPLKVEPRLRQSFAEATVAEPPADQCPPDTTMTGKSVGKLYTQVVRLWDEVAFVSAASLPLDYQATLETDMGTIVIALRPELAPNHVRSFVALARAGYYDGLVFERTLHEVLEGQAEARMEVIEAGCPLGTAETGPGSIGYWLKPEVNPQAVHEEGTVGACRASEEDTTACRFYINLCPAPYLDGNYTVFGKVTQGLDVAHKILSMPVRNDAEFPEGDRPANPIVIRKLTIQTQERQK